MFHEFTPWRDCDRGYGRPSLRATGSTLRLPARRAYSPERAQSPTGRSRAGSRASSGVTPCDVPFRYTSSPIPRYRGTVARLHAHLHDLAAAIHQTSGLKRFFGPLSKIETIITLASKKEDQGWPDISRIALAGPIHQRSGLNSGR